MRQFSVLYLILSLWCTCQQQYPLSVNVKVILSSYVPCPWDPSNGKLLSLLLQTYQAKMVPLFLATFCSQRKNSIEALLGARSFWKFCSTLFLLVLGWMVLVPAGFILLACALLVFKSASVCTATASAIIAHLGDLPCGQSIHWNESCIVSCALLHRNSTFLLWCLLFCSEHNEKGSNPWVK